jgi:hypothetical protein
MMRLIFLFLALAPAIASAGDKFPDVVATDLDSLQVFRGDGAGGFLEPIGLYIADAVEPWSVAIGDLTGDGLPEIVSANRYGPHLAIFRNLGEGAFEQPPKIIPTSEVETEYPYDVDLGDLDRDGDLDIVVTCNYDPGIVLLLFNDGAGNFDRISDISPGGKSFNSVLVDLDGKDGLDLVVSRNSAQDLAIYLNYGDGNFGLQGTAPAGADPKAIRAADLNGDGKPDVVTANDSAGVITVFLGDGAGGLSLDQTYAAGKGPRELVLPDLDSDGKPDVVVAGGKGSTIVTRFYGSGDGKLADREDFESGPRPNSVDAGDFDLDGNADVAVANWSLDDPTLATLSILYGDGLGGFPRKLDLVPFGGFRKITAVAVGQLDDAGAPPETLFRRGDANADAKLDLTDSIAVLGFLFTGQPATLPCPKSADVDDSGKLDISDGIAGLGFLFLGDAPPPAPYPDCGTDGTADSLSCESFLPCGGG